MMNLTKAARLIVAMDERGDLNNAQGRKARTRLSGMLSVWEALTGKTLDDAYAIASMADEWVLATPGLDRYRDDRQVGQSVSTTDPFEYPGKGEEAEYHKAKQAMNDYVED